MRKEVRITQNLLLLLSLCCSLLVSLLPHAELRAEELQFISAARVDFPQIALNNKGASLSCITTKSGRTEPALLNRRGAVQRSKKLISIRLKRRIRRMQRNRIASVESTERRKIRRKIRRSLLRKLQFKEYAKLCKAMIDKPDLARPPTDPTQDCKGDIDGSYQVDETDLLLLLRDFGSCGAEQDPCNADINNDRAVTDLDLDILLQDWGSCDRESPTPAPTPTPYPHTTNSISQDGVTFTFAEAVPYGQFANGDYWVLAPVQITEITPEFKQHDFTGNGCEEDCVRKIHGWEVSPQSVVNAYDERVPVTFASDRVPLLPYLAQAGDSIIKSVSWIEQGYQPDEAFRSCSLVDSSASTCLQSAVVLTVLGEIPEEGGKNFLRPPYYGTEKTLYKLDSFDFSLVPHLANPCEPPYESCASAELPPSWETVHDWFRPVQLDFNGMGAHQRSLHPRDNLGAYPSVTAVRHGVALSVMMLENLSSEQRMALITAYLQTGVDYYHMWKSGRKWGAGAGFSQGRKLPVVFFATLIDNQAVKDTVRSIPEMHWNSFGEDGHLYTSERANYGMGAVLFGNPSTSCSDSSYWHSVRSPGSGQRDCKDPYQFIDGGERPGGAYQSCCNSKTWKGPALAANLIPGMKALWNYEPFFEYVDRWVEFGTHAMPDPCAPYSEGATYGVDYGPLPSSMTRYVDIDSISELSHAHDGTYPLSIHAWVKTSAAEAMTIFGIYRSNNANHRLELGVNAEGKLTASAKRNSAEVILLGPRIDNNDWQHVVAVFASPDSHTLYLNGVVVDHAATPVQYPDFMSKPSIAASRANYANQGPGQFFLGSIDDVRLYQRALSATEVANLFAQNGTATGLLAYYRLDGDTLDSSGNGNHGSPDWGPTYVDGKIGDALEFNLNAMCILDADLAYYNSPSDFACQDGQECGRFPELHGAHVNGGAHFSYFVERMWEAYRH